MEKSNYLIHIQYLGFRYHGWQKQPDVRTVEHMLEKTIAHVLGNRKFKLLGSSRTDAMVSALHSACELFLDHPADTAALLSDLNRNLPNDIRITGIEAVSGEFNILQTPREKEYVYLFAFGEKPHPFSAPLVYTYQGNLDIEAMKQGAGLFKGCHNFERYCTKPGPNTQLVREILESDIRENTVVAASFFPEKTWAFHVRSKGFMRNQIRLIMGQLLRLGRNEIDMNGIKNSLKGNGGGPLREIAPASGLVLNRIRFDQPAGE